MMRRRGRTRSFEISTALQGLAAFGAVGPDLDGLPTLAIGITDDSAVIDTYSTDGDVLVDRVAADELRQLIVPGSKVEMLGTPPPTPEPTPTVDTDFLNPSAGNSGEFTPCPNDAFGSYPNCYRVIDRLTTRGECTGSALEVDGRCMIFGGDPLVTVDFTCEEDGGAVDASCIVEELQCPPSAPEMLSDRCYVEVGPIPQLEGACPPGSREIDGECRVNT